MTRSGNGQGYGSQENIDIRDTADQRHVLSRIGGSLTAKIAVTLGALIAVGGSAFWYVSVQNDRANLMENTIAFVSSFSEVVKKSIRNDMLHEHRGNIQKTLESVGASETIARVQILDAGGIIAYSSDKRELGQRVGHDSVACIGCHGDISGRREMLRRDRQWTIYTDTAGFRNLSFVEPIYNEPDCYTAACHAHGRDRKVLGMLTTDFSLQQMDRKIRGQVIATSWSLLLFLAVSGVIVYSVFWRFVLRPVNLLSAGIEKITSGDLSHRVSAASEDEIGRLSLAFNAMTEELNNARQRMERWNLSLGEEVKKKTDEIMMTQKRLIQAEKMAALGRLTADVAHEIRNPLTAVGGYARRLHRTLFSPREKEYAGIIVSEVHRLEKILRDVLTFSREVKISFENIPVNDMVRDCIVSFSALCDEHAITIDERLQADLPVFIDTGQARQAVNNLIANAVDAMPGGGDLLVSTAMEQRHGANFAVVHISDTGIGIPEDQLQVVFEPFYTTKEMGRGTGLGLAISRKVMEEHGGYISAENRKCGGLTASLYFPYQSREELCRTPCWEFMQCQRNAGREQKCPVYPHFGRVCWVVGGTYCEGRVQGTFAQKCEDCKKCSFYQKVLSGEI
ncbi:MAG: HAMP domain-containing histidine kinase [Nitrospirae bacterium]|nr:HAMP domain-containing histidine kinase [Nitrospirota bacterium]